MDIRTFLFALVNNGEKERTGYILSQNYETNAVRDTSTLVLFEDRYLRGRTTTHSHIL